MAFSDNALTILKKRYLREDETPEEMLRRTASAVASSEPEEQRAHWEERFYQLMERLEFLPNSPTLMNAGKPDGQLAACFVLPVDDSMESIFSTLKQTALIHKSGGGTGFNFSSLRPAGDLVSTTNGVASGPVSFMGMFDLSTDVVKQGGTRRGANMGILNCDHPDILDFIRAKTEEGRLRNFNISVGITDAFMEAARDNQPWDLVNPRTGVVAETVNARELFETLVHAAWATGDPGLIFLDRLEEGNPTPHVGTIDATNPCVTGDTFVLTDQGPKTVRECLGTQQRLIVNGTPCDTTEAGFFATGTKPVMRLRTREGYSLRATEDHPVQRVTETTRTNIRVEWAGAGELKPGDRVMLHNHRGLPPRWEGLYGDSEGYLLGLLTGDGTLKNDKALLSVWTEEAQAAGGECYPADVAGIMETAATGARQLPHRSDFAGWWRVEGRSGYRLSLSALKEIALSLGMTPGNKTITPYLETATSSAFAAGFLRGFFDADASVQGTRQKGISIRLAQSDLPRLEAVQRMLARFGVISTIYRDRRHAGTASLPDGRGGSADYTISAQHELEIAGDNIPVFAERIGFSDTVRERRLSDAMNAYRHTPNRERFTATVASVTPDGTEEVYDVQVPGANAFDANGLVVHNCGEQPLLPYEACNLGSVNLSLMVENGEILWDRLAETVDVSVRFLDDVIDVNRYPLDEIRNLALGNRKIGLGVMGWAEMLFKLRIPYNSTEATDLARELMAFFNTKAHEAGVRLAEERGPYPNCRGERRRNATVTTIAPTGTISLIAECSSGIEPVFALHHTRKAFGTDELTYVNGTLKEELDKQGVDDLAELPEAMQRVFVTAHDIEPEWHVRMQAAFQEHVDNAVSKTINLPHTATREDVEGAYLLSFRLRCKGITVYRDSCKSEQVLYTPKRNAPGEGEEGTARHPRQRPQLLTGKTIKMPTSFGNLYLTVNEIDGSPFELFATLGKSGKDTQAHTEALGRLISLSLRSGVAMQEIIDQLRGIGGSQPVWDEEGVILSLPDAIARGLERATGSVSHVPAADMCPSCGALLVREEGCVKCPSCGYSKC